MRDGVWRESGILRTFPAGGVRTLWRARVGPGYSGVVVAQGRVYVCDCQLEPESVERVWCFKERDGTSLWSFSYPCSYDGLYYGGGPYATPVVDDGRLYLCSPKGHLHCLDAATGKLLWKRDRVQEYGAILPQSGCNSSPMIEGDLLLVMGGGHTDGCVTAFDKRTGEEKWSALKERPGGSSPIVVESGGRRQAIFWTLDSVSSLDPQSGEVFWHNTTRTINDGGALTTPAVCHDLLLCVCEKALLLKLDATKPAAALQSQTGLRKKTNTFVSPVFQDDHHYYSALSDDLCCFEVSSGNQLWTAKGVSAGHGNAMFQMTVNGDRVFILNEDGQLILARLSPAHYEELGRTTLLEPTKGTWTPTGDRPKIWAQAAYANGHIFARSDQEIVCASLLEK